jgi:DNA-binding HxlR family transcriptional regulator
VRIYTKQEGTKKFPAYRKVSICQYQRIMEEKKFKIYADEGHCPVRNVVDRIGDKWSVLILLLLEEGEVLRFGEIHKYIGTISQKMLTVTLKTLEADGLVIRTVYAQIPPRVEYRLSPRGKTLLPHIHGLVTWAVTNMKDIRKTRKKFEEGVGVRD